MIPPSTIMVIYGIITETNIGKLFAAGVLPGILGAVLLCVAVRLHHLARSRRAGPPGRARVLARALGARCADVWAVAVALPLRDGRHLRRRLHRHRGRGHRRLRRAGLRAGAARAHLARRSTTRCSRARAPPSMLFMILIGALMFAKFVNITTMPGDLKDFVTRFELSPIMVVARDLRDLRGPRHRDGGAVDGPAHHAGVLPGDRAPRLRPGLVRHHHRRAWSRSA